MACHLYPPAPIKELKNGYYCKVVAGTHKGKLGIVQDLNTSRTGHVTITVVQDNGIKFKTLGRNVEAMEKP